MSVPFGVRPSEWPAAVFERDLIYDLGMHRGLDTKFYVDKGFRVVALEANPELVQRARTEFREQLEDGRLSIVERALWREADTAISFFLNPVKDDWSSVFKDWAEKGGHESGEVTVSTITLPSMFDLYGLPYYVKCDIEGADELFVRQLMADDRRPPFVSVEAISLDLLALLFAAGYTHFQIVNQAFNGYVLPPQPSREGRYAPITFTGHMSGLFGLELEPGRWRTFDAAARDYIDFIRLAKQDERLAHGWLDFHATTEVMLHAGR